MAGNAKVPQVALMLSVSVLLAWRQPVIEAAGRNIVRSVEIKNYAPYDIEVFVTYGSDDQLRRGLQRIVEHRLLESGAVVAFDAKDVKFPAPSTRVTPAPPIFPPLATPPSASAAPSFEDRNSIQRTENQEPPQQPQELHHVQQPQEHSQQHAYQRARHSQSSYRLHHVYQQREQEEAEQRRRYEERRHQHRMEQERRQQELDQERRQHQLERERRQQHLEEQERRKQIEMEQEQHHQLEPKLPGEQQRPRQPDTSSVPPDGSTAHLRNDYNLYKSVKLQRHPEVVKFLGDAAPASSPTNRRRVRALGSAAFRRSKRVIRYRHVGAEQEERGRSQDGARSRRSLSRRQRSYSYRTAPGVAYEYVGGGGGENLEPAGVSLLVAVHHKSFNSVAHRPVGHGVEERLYFAIVNVEQHGMYITQVPGFPN